MRRWLVAGLAPLLMAQAPASQTVASQAPAQVSLTIYNSSLWQRAGAGGGGGAEP